MFDVIPKTFHNIIHCSGVVTTINLNLLKAAGPDELKPTLLKELTNEIVPILTQVFKNH
jgi:hypothetical protein